jgi:signal transduction histidine kinase/ActR/RegA family two-component response regulator
LNLLRWLWPPRAAGTRRSVRSKLMIVVVQTTGVALLVASAALLVNDLANYRRVRAADLATEASILALASAPALAFDDHAAAVDSLATLRVHQAARAAALYTADGRLYAQFVRPGERPPPTQLPRSITPTYMRGAQIELTQRIERNGEWLGTLYLRGSYPIGDPLMAYVAILVLVAAASLVVALILSSSLQRAITSPLDAMALVASGVVNRGDYTQRAPRSADDEIGLVVDAFNRMLDEVQSRTRELELSISQLKATEDALREADRRKDEFLATLAHELRNPLAPIRNAAELLEIPSVDDVQRKWARDVIARQVQRMGLLLDDLLDVSRITRGRLELKKKQVHLASLVATAIETVDPLIKAKGQSLQVSLPSEPIELQVDPLRISQAISNLLNNAAKYTDERGVVKLSARLEATGLRIAVEDTGVGFEPSAQPKLFEMFSQIESRPERTEGGLGIGLALVKGLITLHGGTAEAASAGPGQGSTFTLRLPAYAVVTGPHPVGAPVAVPLQVTCRIGKIIIVDDNRDAAETLGSILSKWGHQVLLAHNGLAALELGARERADAFILDIGMPGLSGYEVARRIRSEPWGSHTLLLAMTGWGQTEDIARAKQAGFDEHLTKPVDLTQVAGILLKYLGAARPELRTRSAASSCGGDGHDPTPERTD